MVIDADGEGLESEQGFGARIGQIDRDGVKEDAAAGQLGDGGLVGPSPVILEEGFDQGVAGVFQLLEAGTGQGDQAAGIQRGEGRAPPGRGEDLLGARDELHIVFDTGFGGVVVTLAHAAVHAHERGLPGQGGVAGQGLAQGLQRAGGNDRDRITLVGQRVGRVQEGLDAVLMDLARIIG